MSDLPLSAAALWLVTGSGVALPVHEIPRLCVRTVPRCAARVPPGRLRVMAICALRCTRALGGGSSLHLTPTGARVTERNASVIAHIDTSLNTLLRAHVTPVTTSAEPFGVNGATVVSLSDTICH
jgi:hypothetical protein